MITPLGHVQTVIVRVESWRRIAGRSCQTDLVHDVRDVVDPLLRDLATSDRQSMAHVCSQSGALSRGEDGQEVSGDVVRPFSTVLIRSEFSAASD